MIPGLWITNFRLFKRLEIENFSRVNLFVGKNNSGKSCLLEALQIFASNAHPEVLLSLIIERGEDWKIHYISDHGPFFNQIEENHPFRHLFNGYRLEESTYIDIRLPFKPKRDDHIICLRYEMFYQQTSYDNVDIEPRLEISIPHKQYYIKLDDINMFLPTSEHRYSDIKPLYPFQFISTRLLTNKKVHMLWDSISLKPSLRQEVFNALKLIDKDIFEVTLISDGTPILIYSDDKQLPLRSLGDGATHLFHIILALVNAKDGLLLIDEFENGLHYSIQPKIWKLIFTLSERLNVQVFATTHSQDCIQGFAEAWAENEELGTFYRLDNYKNKTKATPYDVELLDFDLNNDGEVR